MASNVVVPANFGKHHLKSRTHNNLELLCAEGEVQRANSMILTLNSSVIEDLIARLEITSLDMQEFAAPAVNCFVESMYSGELENCDRTNFRDLNKMGHVFDVAWFVERCLRYFTDLVDKVDGRCYEDVLFVAEEAWFVEENLKKSELMDLIIGKLSKLGNKKSIFLKQYAADLEKISINQLKMVVKIAEQDVGILASVLANHLEKCGASTMSDTTRFLFENMDFVQSFSNRRYFDITHNIITRILNDSHNTEFKSAVKYISKLSPPEKFRGINSICEIFRYPVVVDIAIEDFLKLDWYSLCVFLSQSDKIRNLYHFFDAIYMWLFIASGDLDKKVPRLDFSDHNYVMEISDIAYDRCWGKVSRVYLELLSSSDVLGIDRLIKSFYNSDELSCEIGTVFESKQGYNFNMLLSEENLEIQLFLRGEVKVPGCTEDSQCGILLKCSLLNVQETAKSFQLEVVRGLVNEKNTHIHYHNDSGSTQTVNLLINVCHGESENITPIPFNTPPLSYGDGSWDWGIHYYSVDNQVSSQLPCHYSFNYQSDVLIKFIACLSANNY